MGSIASVVGGVAGGVGGFMMGGPAGAALGYTAGSALGGAVGGSSSGGGKGGSSNIPAVDPSIAQAQSTVTNNANQFLTDWKTNVLPNLQSSINTSNAAAGNVANTDFAFKDTAYNQAQQGLNQYNQNFVPVQNNIAQGALNYNTEANYNRLANSAMGDVNNAFDVSRQNIERQYQGFGINPTSGAYAGQTNANEVLRAGQAAAASTMARNAAEQLGWQRNLDAANVGQNVYANAGSAANFGLNAGNAAMTASNVPVSNYGTLSSNMYNAYGLPINAALGTGQLGVSSYNAQTGAWGAQQNANAVSSAGYGSALGSVAGVGLKYGLDKGFGTSTPTQAIGS